MKKIINFRFHVGGGFTKKLIKYQVLTRNLESVYVHNVSPKLTVGRISKPYTDIVIVNYY